jgi:hypothetical protein
MAGGLVHLRPPIAANRSGTGDVGSSGPFVGLEEIGDGIWSIADGLLAPALQKSQKRVQKRLPEARPAQRPGSCWIAAVSHKPAAASRPCGTNRAGDDQIVALPTRRKRERFRAG